MRSVKYNFENKVVLVTGAGTGIGLATAIAFAESGATVVLAGKSESNVKDEANKIIANGGKAIGIGCDIADEQQVKTLISKIVMTYGSLDVAFNNAGVISHPTLTTELTNDEWERIMSINLKGTWLCMKHEIGQMLVQGKGVIVNNSSMGGLRGAAGLSAYAASKHGVLGLTKSASLEYITKGIRINAVCPGMISTPMGDDLTAGNKQALEEMTQIPPMKRFGQPEEVAAAVLWLCSDEANYVLGQGLTIDGGITV